MNKVFKVIWSEARNAYVVVSEMAKSHGTKSCSTKKLLAMLIATGVMTCASVAPAMAANLAPNDTKIEVGKDASASGQGSVAIGNNAQASGLVGIAIGRDAVASGTDSIAIGSSTKAGQTYSVAVGNDIGFTAYAGTAVGQQAYASGDNATAIGTMTNVDAKYNASHDDWRKAGAQSTAIGAYAGSWGLASTAVGGFSKAEGKLATAIGYHSQANVDYGTALGDYSEVTAGWGVAIGASSVADREAGVVGAFAPEGADSLTWRANGGAVSVGSATLTRQITNVAAGTADTDAVNVAQLQEATQNTAWHLLAEEEITKDVNSTTKINHGDIVHFRGTDDNITISKEETEDATVMHVELSRNLVIDSVQAGDYFMDSYRGIGVGRDAYITEDGLNANDKVITNVAAGVYNTDAVNVGQLKEVEEVAANANKGWNLSTNGVATSAINVAPGEYVDFSGDKNISVSNDGTKVKAELNKDLVDIESISNGDAKLALNGAAGTAGMINGKGASIYMQDGYTVINSKVAFDQNGKISGVAAGVADTDAVNVSQLKNSAWKLAANGVLTEAEDVKADEYVDFSGDQNVSVSKDAKDGVKAVKVELNKDLVGIESISNGDAKMALNGAAGTAGMINGKGAYIYMQDGYTVINSKVAFDQNGKISGVAAGAITADSTDAVNGSQLHAVATEAGKHSKVVNGSNINVEEFDNDGQKIYKVNLNKDIMLGDLTGKYVNISGTNGTIETTGYIATQDRVYADKGGKLADIDVTGNKISNGASSIVLDGSNVKVNDKVTIDQNGKISGVAAGVADTDAVNVGQLKEAVEAGNTDTHIKPGEYGVDADNKVIMDVVDKNGNKVDTVTIKDVAKASDVGDVNNIANDIKNKEGKTTVVDAVNNLNNKVGDLQYSKVEKGDIADGDSTTTAIGKLDQKLTDVAATAAKHTKVEGSSNITVTNTAKEGEAANYKVELNKDIDVETVKANSVTTGQTVMNNDGLKVGKDVSVTATAVKVGDTTITDKGLEIKDGPSVTKDGINAGNKKVTGVADGDVKENSKDAINGGQLHQVKADSNNRIDGVENQVVNNTNRINKLGSRVNKVGAGAAALAALHPMDFDPDDKLTFSAGYGNYAGENAAAIGAYYRPDEKVMFSVAGTVGNGENMVNAGVSFALDRTNHVSNSRTALAREVIDLRGQLAVMGAKMAKMEKAFGMLDETKTKLFPDVPANHWAYEYIAKLAGNGYIEGYPDGNFGGDRLMTRYEFAAMLYRAIENGAALEEKIIKEFEPELGRIRVDRISGEDGDRDKIERVRVNDTKGERDHYGNKLAK